MNDLYTCGIWTVRAGREDEFVAAWEDLARWSGDNAPGAGWATLVQQEDQPSRFLTFGPWESLEAIDAWRASDGFRDRVGRIRALLDDFQPGTFRRRAGVGGG